jgi:hypothetical protein
MGSTVEPRESCQLREGLGGVGQSRAWCLIAVHILFPLAVGTTIYVLWRTSDLPMFDWAESAGLTQLIEVSRARWGEVKHGLPPWVIYSLPDALWTYALTISICLIWEGREGRSALAWTCLPLVVSVGSEFLQLAGCIPGTFDYRDVYISAGSWFAAVAVMRYRSRVYLPGINSSQTRHPQTP